MPTCESNYIQLYVHTGKIPEGNFLWENSGGWNCHRGNSGYPPYAMSVRSLLRIWCGTVDDITIEKSACSSSSDLPMYRLIWNWYSFPYSVTVTTVRVAIYRRYINAYAVMCNVAKRWSLVILNTTYSEIGTPFLFLVSISRVLIMVAWSWLCHRGHVSCEQKNLSRRGAI